MMHAPCPIWTRRSADIGTVAMIDALKNRKVLHLGGEHSFARSFQQVGKLRSQFRDLVFHEGES